MANASTLNYNSFVDAAVRRIKSAQLAGKSKATLVFGPPGSGKTAAETLIAQRAGLQHVYRTKPSHHEVTDYSGLPVPNHDLQRTFFFVSGDMLPPSDLQGGLLVTVDEAGDCNVAQQNLICQWVFEGKMHGYMFPENTHFLLTSNRVHDRSGANRIVTKLGNRVASYTLAPAVEELFDYGARHGWNPTVLAFLKMHGGELINPSDKRGADAPTYFNSFDPGDAAQMAMPQFASSRSWEDVSDYCNYLDAHEAKLGDGTTMAELSGMVGDSVAGKFTGFRATSKTMPDPDAILKGQKVAYPDETGVLWALTLTLVSRVKKDTVKHMHAWLDKGPDEYLALGARLAFDTKVNELSGPDFHALIKNPKIKAMFVV